MKKDHKDLNEKPRLKTLYPMETSISELYTHEMFYQFQEQLFQSMAYKVMIKNEDDYYCVYNVERLKGGGLRVCDHGIKEPLPVRAKGCGKRMKGGKEKTVKKARRCHGCGLTGQSHDKRNCPALVNVYLLLMIGY
ncbi:hypothetical protein Dimus_011324 [Dionaea muscipula]